MIPPVLIFDTDMMDHAHTNAFITAVSRHLDEVQAPTPSTPPDGVIVTNNDSELIRETLRLFGSMFLCTLLVYELFLRKRYQRLYNIRSWVEDHKCKLAMKEYSVPFSWMWQVFQISDEDLMKHCGLDALCFLRALRFGRKLTIMGCFNAIWLIPMYYTAGDSEETAYLEDPLVLMVRSTSHCSAAVRCACDQPFYWFTCIQCSSLSSTTLFSILS